MKLRHILIPVTAIALLAAAPFAMAGRDDYETPDYEVVKSDGSFEVRDYIRRSYCVNRSHAVAVLSSNIATMSTL